MNLENPQNNNEKNARLIFENTLTEIASTVRQEIKTLELTSSADFLDFDKVIENTIGQAVEAYGNIQDEMEATILAQHPRLQIDMETQMAIHNQHADFVVESMQSMSQSLIERLKHQNKEIENLDNALFTLKTLLEEKNDSELLKAYIEIEKASVSAYFDASNRLQKEISALVLERNELKQNMFAKEGEIIDLLQNQDLARIKDYEIEILENNTSTILILFQEQLEDIVEKAQSHYRNDS